MLPVDEPQASRVRSVLGSSPPADLYDSVAWWDDAMHAATRVVWVRAGAVGVAVTTGTRRPGAEGVVR
jgi:hypothetical protein